MLKERNFLKVLQERLPHWVAQGWVAPGDRQAILEDAEALAGTQPRYLIVAFYLMGVILLGLGVVTFVAANWAGMSNALKLALLFGGLWASYLLAGWCAAGHRWPYLSGALLLLGVIFFGTSINLISQIYHIEGHYPDAILAWSLGGLLVAWSMASQPAYLAALGLALLWAGVEIIGFRFGFHWHFLLVWGAGLPLVLMRQWRLASHAALIALSIWALLVLYDLTLVRFFRNPANLTQFYLVSFAVVALLGRGLEPIERLRPFPALLKRYGILGAVVAFFVLTFPAPWLRMPVGSPIGPAWAATAVQVVGLGAVALAGAWAGWRSLKRPVPLWVSIGGVLFGVIALTLAVNLWLAPAAMGRYFPIPFNLLFFATLTWLVYTGYQLGERFHINLAFLFFAVLLLTRYFDTFWTLLGRSYFFMGGGLLLVLIGLAMEPQRRRLMRGMGGPAAENKTSGTGE